MKRPFATLWREGNWYVSQCLEVDIASQGESEDEALANLKEALELHFEPPQATRPTAQSLRATKRAAVYTKCLTLPRSGEIVDTAIVPNKNTRFPSAR